MRVHCVHILSALILSWILWTLPFVDFSWTSVCRAKPNRLTVSWKPLRLDMCNVIQTYSHQTVRRILNDDFVALRADSAVDHPYVLAFSLIMLHTDAFNKSNKRKMTKPDYIKNTRLPGVPSEVLDVSGPLPFNCTRLTNFDISAFMTISYSLPSFSLRIPWTLMVSGV